MYDTHTYLGQQIKITGNNILSMHTESRDNNKYHNDIIQSVLENRCTYVALARVRQTRAR